MLTRDRSEACRAAVREFRSGRALPAALVIVALTAAGATAATEVVSTMLGRPVVPPVFVARVIRAARAVAWHDPVVLAVAAGLALIGSLLLLTALLPGRGRAVAMAGDDPSFVAGVRRSGLRAALRGTALTVSGIDEARVRLRGRLRPRAVVHAVTGYRNPGSLYDQVADAVRERLERIDLVRVPRVAVRLTWRKD